MNESFRERWAAHQEARKAFELPPEIQELLGAPPVLLGEDIEWYEKTRSKFATAIGPEDCIIWILVEDVTYCTAEIRRFREMKITRLNAVRSACCTN